MIQGYDYFRPVVKGVAAKKLLDIMRWTGELSYEEVVANSIDARWQHLREEHDELRVLNQRDEALRMVQNNKVKTQ